ncbi:MAG TPA: SRPBCC domain-containing protein, partial [Saprospiraceae bacterium]|nr:SRPBCC domain-containing protein [Saprospiraceae bacterium]
MQEFIVKKEITINAPPSEVWDALTNPDKTKKYFFNCKVYSDWKVGSPISFKGRIFLIKKIEFNGTILKIEPEKLLEYNLKNGKNDNKHLGFSIVTDKLSFKNGLTILTISDNVGNGKGAEERY